MNKPFLLRPLLGLPLFAFWFLITASSLNAQESADSLRLEEALMQSLTQNHAIRGARYRDTVSMNDALPGNAGLLPTISLNGTYQEQLQNTETQFANPEMMPIEADGANTTTYNASVGLEYTLFNGLTRIRSRERLKASREQTRAQTRQTVEQTLLATAQSYLQAARQAENLRIQQEAVALSRERMERSQIAYELGSGSRLARLNAEVDLNADSAALLQAKTALANAKRQLKAQMGQAPEADFVLARQIDLRGAMEPGELQSRAQADNSRLAQLEQQMRVARLQEQIARGGQYPRLQLSSQYGYNRQEYEANFLTSQESLGLTAGLSVAYTLYDGNQRNIQIDNARLGMARVEAQQEQARLEIQREVANTFADFQNQQKRLALAQRNRQTAQLNFERSREAYRTGNITSTQLREAQVNLIRAEQQVSNLRFDLKFTELSLMQLSGQILEEMPN